MRIFAVCTRHLYLKSKNRVVIIRCLWARVVDKPSSWVEKVLLATAGSSQSGAVCSSAPTVQGQSTGRGVRSPGFQAKFLMPSQGLRSVIMQVIELYQTNLPSERFPFLRPSHKHYYRDCCHPGRSSCDWESKRTGTARAVIVAAPQISLCTESQSSLWSQDDAETKPFCSFLFFQQTPVEVDPKSRSIHVGCRGFRGESDRVLPSPPLWFPPTARYCHTSGIHSLCVTAAAETASTSRRLLPQWSSPFCTGEEMYRALSPCLPWPSPWPEEEGNAITRLCPAWKLRSPLRPLLPFSSSKLVVPDLLPLVCPFNTHF